MNNWINNIDDRIAEQLGNSDKRRKEELENYENRHSNSEFLDSRFKYIDEYFDEYANYEWIKIDRSLERFDWIWNLYWDFKEWSEEYKYIEVYFNIKREELEKIVQLKKEIIS